MCRVQRELADTLVELAEVDQALDDVLGLLHEVEADLLHLDLVAGDPNYCEMLANNVQVYGRCTIFTTRTMLCAVYAWPCVCHCCVCLSLCVRVCQKSELY